MARTIATILNLRDLFSPQLQQTVNKTKEFQKELQHAQNNVSGFKNKVSSSFLSLKSSVVGLGIGLASGLNMQSMIASAQAGQKATAQMNSVLASTKGVAGMTKDELLNLATAQSRVTTFSKGTTMAAENLLLTFTGVSKKTFPDTIKAAQDMSTVMKTDLNSSVMTLGKALNDPATGLSKLTKQGVNFTESQKSQIKAMVAVGDTAGAQKLMLAELNKEFGGSAKAAASTLPGQIAIIKQSFAGLGGSIATTVLPYVTQFATFASDKLPPAIAAIGSVIKNISPLIAGIVKDMGQIITNLIPSFGTGTNNLQKTIQNLISNGLGAVKDVFDWIAQHGEITRVAIVGIGTAFAGWKIASSAMGVISWIEKIKKTADSFKTLSKGGSILKALFGLPPTVTIIIAAITAVAMVAYLVISHWTQVKTFFTGLWTWLKQEFNKFLIWLKTFMSGWGGVLLIALNPFIGIPVAIILHWNQIKTFFTGLGTWLVMKWTNTMAWFATLPGKWYAYGSNMFTSFKTGIATIVAGIGIWISNAFTGFVSFFTSLPGKAITWAKDMLDGFIRGIENKIADVKKGASNIADTIRKILHFSTPDEGPLKPYATWMPDFVNGMNQGIVTTTPNIVKGVTNMATNMTSPISSFVSANNGLGINSVQELSAGISSQEGNAVATAQSLASKILQGVKDIFGIHSPSRAMGTVGINFMQGFINKLKSSNIGDVVKKVFGNIASLANGELGGSLSSIVSNFINTGDLKGLGGMLQGVMQNGLGFLSGGGNIGQWISTAMALTGVSSDWMGPLQEIIQHESGGDPNNINTYDINAQEGHPSKGLMQLIDENMQDFHLPGLSNIYDPISNIAAGIRLIQHDYGSIYNVPGIKALARGGSYVGYANGGVATQASIFGEAGAEMAIPLKRNNPRSNQLLNQANTIINGNSGQNKQGINVYVVIQGNVIGNEEFADEVGSTIATRVLTKLENM